MSKKDKVINNPDENADAKKIQKWSVWTQGPKDAKETQRKFKLTTPGQERDYKKLVSKRRFQRFEQIESVKPKKEEAPVNSVAGGGVAGVGVAGVGGRRGGLASVCCFFRGAGRRVLV